MDRDYSREDEGNGSVPALFLQLGVILGVNLGVILGGPCLPGAGDLFSQILDQILERGFNLWWRNQ